MSSPDPFDDLQKFALPTPAPQIGPISPRATPRCRRGERFLKGPIPWPWLARAARQPGKALQVALALWLWAGITKCGVVALSLSRLDADVGVSRDAGRRGLEALEAAGLVSVERHAGRKPVVTLLDVSDSADAG